MGFHDIFGFDPDLLAMVPTPCHAVLLLFTITDATEKAKDTEAAEIQATGQDVSENVSETFYLRTGN
jgi:ubiquitin carboxyl-terminal hydrolase L3